LLFQTSIGIDIQENAIAVVYLKESFKGVKLAAYGTYPLEENLPIHDMGERLERVVNDFMSQNRISSGALFLGIPRRVAVLRYVELPLVVKENLKDSLKYELEKYVPFPPDELYFDYQIISEDKKTDKMKLLLLVVKRDSIDSFVSLGKIPGVRLSGIEISSIALANFFAMQERSNKKNPRAMICGRKGGFELDLLNSGFLAYSRLMDGVEGDADSLEWLSRKLREIKETRQDPEMPLTTVLCDINGESGLASHLKMMEDIDVHVFDPSTAGLPSSNMIAAYGLALKGLQEVPSDINLLPESMRKKPSRAGYYAMVGLVGVIIVLALAWIGGTVFHSQRYVKQLDNEIHKLDGQVAKLNQIEVECDRTEKQIEFLEPLWRNRCIVLDVIKDLSERIPRSAWLLRFTYSDRDNKVQLEGWADSASDLIPALDDSPLFKDVGFLSSITRSSGGKERFRIGLEVVRERPR